MLAILMAKENQPSIRLSEDDPTHISSACWLDGPRWAYEDLLVVGVVPRQDIADMTQKKRRALSSPRVNCFKLGIRRFREYQIGTGADSEGDRELANRDHRCQREYTGNLDFQTRHYSTRRKSPLECC